MESKYIAWINKNCKEYNEVVGKCIERTNEMIVEFPELKIVKGFACRVNGNGEVSKKYLHQWLVNENGEIIDPTKGQYDAICFFYEEIQDDDPKPKGKCINCGNWVYDNSFTCSDKCSEEAARIIMSRGII